MLTSDSISTLRDKVAVLTGASRGIGKSISDALVEAGCKVAIGDVLEKEGQELVESYNKKAGSKVAVFLRTDVTKYRDNIGLFNLAEKEFGGVDIALLNAAIGVNSDSMFTPLDDEVEERIIDINTTAVIKGTKVALLHMAKRGGGCIVHMSSVAGLHAHPNLASYSASKHAIVGYTRSFQLMPLICNVRVNALCPFWIDTDMTAFANQSNFEKKPYSKVISDAPHAKMETLVEGFMTLITDKSRNTQTIKVLPEGLVIDVPRTAPDSFSGDLNNEALKEYIPAAVKVGKYHLAKALKRYEQQLLTLGTSKL
ncbi:hypothetical protein BD770DRAFT_414123 [Pilaira anomala]|nr:hypothetical protein BD770DRAFT_414123 [Pilaira anomala]